GRLPQIPRHSRSRRADREPERERGPALGVLPLPLGNAVRARELPERQGVREGCPGAAVASCPPRAMSAPTTSDPARPAVATTRDGAASARIAESIRSEILGGELKPGERIRQEDLAARFGASRLPVREALRSLE